VAALKSKWPWQCITMSTSNMDIESNGGAKKSLSSTSEKSEVNSTEQVIQLFFLFTRYIQ
jgi:hypothetical protein